MDNLLDKKGWNFSAVISNQNCEGVIQVEDNVVYLCQNVVPGSAPNDCLGYKYGWDVTIGSPNNLHVSNVKNLILNKPKSSSALPEYWCVRNDNNRIFKDTVVAYINKLTGKNLNGGILYYYYGVFPDTTLSVSLDHRDSKILTIKEFISLTEAETSESTKSITIKKEENENKNSEGNIIKINRPISTISVGKRCTGHTIYGKRGRAAIVFGHLSYREISVF